MEFVNISSERKRHMPIKIGHAPSTNKTINIISQNKECSNSERRKYMDNAVAISAHRFECLVRREFLYEYFRSLLLEGEDIPKDTASRLVEIADEKES